VTRAALFALPLLALASCELAGCSMSNSAGGNLSGADPTGARAGCGAVNATFGAGSGNGGVCVWQPCAIGRQSIGGKTGDIDNLITGWACNPIVPASPVVPTGLPTSPPTAGADAIAADKAAGV
jgi:hypothetical protein